MNTLPELINKEIDKLPLTSQKEVLDFVLFLKKRINPHLTHAINIHLKTTCYDIENLRVALHLKNSV
jgi:hypothetical protein